MKTPAALPSLRAERALAKLGADLAIARKRRRFTQQRVAEGAGISIPTLRRLENGEPGASLGSLAMVLLVLGEADRLGQFLDVAKDDVGLAIAISELPQRVRSKRQPRGAQPGQGSGTGHGIPLPVARHSAPGSPATGTGTDTATGSGTGHGVPLPAARHSAPGSAATGSDDATPVAW